MRALPIICALAVAMAGCAIPVTPTGKDGVEERTTGGKAGAGLAGQGNLTGSNLVAAGAGNLVAAGAGNLATTKASAGIVAAGAGNARADQAGAGIVAAGAGNLAGKPTEIANNGADLIANEAGQPGAVSAPAPGPAASAAPSAGPGPQPSPSPLFASPSPGGLAGLVDPAGMGPNGGGGLIGADGASLLGADGASLIGADAGSLLPPAGGSLAAGTQAPEVILIEEEGDRRASVSVHGTVRGPGALVGRTGTLPVAGAKVALFTLTGTLAAEGVTDGKGAYALTGTVPEGLAVLRSTFKAGARLVYLAAVVDTADAANALDLDPLSTIFEAKFFTGSTGKAADDAKAEGADFPAWHASGAAIVDEVTLAQVAPTATLAQRAAAFDALAAKHPEVGGFVGLRAYLGAM